jgi:gluconolactonase
MVIDAQGRIWFCDSEKKAIRRFNPENHQVETIADKVGEETLNKPNDLAFDSEGNLVFTCPGDSRQEPSGYVCVLQKNGLVKKITTEKYFPNGLAFSPDGRTLTIAETYKHRLWKGDWNAKTCEWTNAKVWVELDGGIGPDGMAFDSEGNLYVAVFDTGKIKVISPKGKIIEEIQTLGKRPTNCAFDPSGKLGLVVTEAEKGLLLSIKINKKAGRLFE